MKCPKCMNDDTSPISNTHYVCNNPLCLNDDGTRVQFKLIQDKKIYFPYNQIFVDKDVSEFYRKPYLKIENTGVTEI